MAASADWTRDGKTHDPGSIISGLTSVDGGSDELDQAISRHARDQQRRDQVLSGFAQPFRKARPLHLNGGHFLQDPDSASQSSGVSDPGVYEQTGTQGSEPAFNIPRDWGRKGRTSTSWLRRGLAQDDIDTDRMRLDFNAAVGSAQKPRAADFRRRSGGVQPVSLECGRPAIHVAEKFDLVHGQAERTENLEEMQDLTAGSMLQGTPMMRAGTSSRRYDLDPSLSHKRDRDLLSRITELAPSTSAKNRLDARRMRTTEAVMARDLRHSPEDKKWGGARAIGANKENFPFRNNDELANGIAHSDNATNDRPHGDAVHILKRLARATSRSPVTSPDAQAEAVRPQSNEARPVRQSSAQAPEVVSKADSTPYISSRNLPAKTPRVMGAWIDTPQTNRHAAAIKAEPSSPTKAELAAAPAPSTNARHPPSALQNLLHPRLPESSPLAAGDETLASLAAILDPTQTLELSATLNLDEIHAELDALRDQKRPLTKTQEERRDELLAIEGMSDRLHAARRGVKEVGRGLRDVEKRVGEIGTVSGSEDWTGGRCESCARGVWRAAWDEALNVIITSHSSSSAMALGTSRTSKLTWLGALLFVLGAWWVTEKSLCSLYCHPTSASTMSSYGVDPDAPVYPFVLPTLIFRPIRFLWAPLSTLLLWTVSGIWTGISSYFSILLEQEAKPGITPSSQLKSTLAENLYHPPPTVRSFLATRSSTTIRRTNAAHTDRRAPPSAPRDEVWDRMDADAEIEDEHRPRGSRFGKLWSWRASPADAAAASQRRQDGGQRQQESSQHADHAVAQGSFSADAEAHSWETDAADDDGFDADGDVPLQSVGNIWETGDGRAGRDFA